MEKKSKKVESHFHKTYKEFDSFYGEKKGTLSKIIDGIFRRSMRLRFEKVISDTAPYENKSVLDVGCGTGRYCITLALKGVKKSAGIDFAENMLKEARNRAENAKVEHICRFVRADFLGMNIEETFDHVFAMGVLDYIETPVPFVKKMVHAAAKSVMISFPSAKGVIQWLRKHYFRKIKKCPVFLYSKTDVRQIALQTGHTFSIKKLAKDYFLTIDIDH